MSTNDKANGTETETETETETKVKATEVKPLTAAEIKEIISKVKGDRKRVVEVPLDAVTESVELNIRDPKDYENLLSLIQDLRHNGQKKEATLEKRGDRIYPLVGNLRRRALGILRKEGAVDPLTVKYNDKGEPIAGTGKVFSTIRAIVLESLTDVERYKIMADHSQVKSLNKVGVFLSCTRGMDVGLSLQDICIQNYDALNLFSGKDRSKVDAVRKELEEAEKANAPKERLDALRKAFDGARFDFHKGTLQHWERVNNCPRIVKEAYIRKLRGEQSWPGNKVVIELVDAHRKDVKEPANMGLVNKDNPGPEFKARWDKEVEAQRIATETGKAPKATSMMSRDQVSTGILQCNDRLVKAVLMIVLREISNDQLPVLDRAHQDFLKGTIDSAAYEEVLNTAFSLATKSS